MKRHISLLVSILNYENRVFSWALHAQSRKMLRKHYYYWDHMNIDLLAFSLHAAFYFLGKWPIVRLRLKTEGNGILMRASPP